jgi:hypothetical protein
MPSGQEFREIALSLPEAQEKETWGHPTFRVRDKMFASMGPEGVTATVKARKDAQRALLGSDPDVFFMPDYVGVHGWVGIRLADADPDEVRELVTEAWLMTAPKRLTRDFGG